MKSFAEKLHDLPVKVRWFVMTDWNVENDEKFYSDMMLKKNISYFAYGEEVCPDSGKPHHQCFMRFNHPRARQKRNLGKIADWWGDTHNYVEAMVEGCNCNETYCKKDGKYHEIGNKPNQGERNDLEELRDSVMNGVSVDEICLESPELFHQYGRTLERLETIRMRKQWRKEMTQGIWFCGKAGYGKDHQWRSVYNPDTHFVKDLSVEWWDGYKQQDTVVLSEFRGHHMRWSSLLTLVDKNPLNVKWRGKESVPFISKTVIITSVLDPVDCYKGKQNDEEWEQFFRRFKVYKILEEHGEPVLIDNAVLDQKCSEGNIRSSEPKFNSPIWDF